MEVWPGRFQSVHEASMHAHNPAALAQRVYGGRLGNRPNTADAFDYRGSGLIQLTGRSNFQAASDAIGIDLVADPDRLRTDRNVAALVACWYWASRGCNELADERPGDDQAKDFAAITRKIQGALGGIDDRVRRWETAEEEIKRAKAALVSEISRLENAATVLGGTRTRGS
jgi:putative chitinase